MTQSGVSRQISQLEALLGIKLFFRVRRRLALTLAGAAYARDIRVALFHIRSATEALLSHQGTGGTLTIAISPTFGTRWLMPRMRNFQVLCPRVMVNLLNYSARPTPLDFAAEHVDAAIFSAVEPTGGVAHKLMPEDLIPVCAPAFLRQGQLTSFKDLARHTLLQHTTLPHSWQDWLNAMGVTDVDGRKGPEFQHMAMVAEAAAGGLGIALLPRFLIADEIASGRLVIAFDVAPFRQRSYFLVYPDKTPLTSALKSFRDWIMDECRRHLLTEDETAVTGQ